MSNVFPFFARMTMQGDWTSGERARLLRLAEHLSGGPDDVDVAFGRTDEGDPWCVVLDHQGDVLVHVARVGGRFIIHHMVDGAFEEGTDLVDTVRRFMGPSWVDDEPDDVVVQLSTQGRKGQGITALIIATAFYYATAAANEDHTPSHHRLQNDDADQQPKTNGLIAELADHATHDTSAAKVLAAVEEAQANGSLHVTVSHREQAPLVQAMQLASAAAQVQAPDHAALAAPDTGHATPEHFKGEAAWILANFEKLVGTDGDDHLVGGPHSSLILAGLGNDHLDGGGAGKGEVDLLDGGPGNDTLVMAANTVANGGKGADTFVVRPAAETTTAEAPAAPGAGTSKSADAGSDKSAHPSFGFAAAGTGANADAHADTTAAAAADANAANQSFGVILDLNPSEGDTIKSVQGNDVTVVSTSPVTDVLFNLRDVPALHGLTAIAGERLVIDINGDGKADGYLLVAHTNGDLVITLNMMVTTTPGSEVLIAPQTGEAPLVGASPEVLGDLF